MVKRCALYIQDRYRTTMNGRMKRLHPTSKHFGCLGNVGNIPKTLSSIRISEESTQNSLDGYSSLPYLLRGTSRTKETDSSIVKSLCKIEEISLVVD